jgi:4a-hydroxytetrahydrobiopterin dehydratase
MNESLVNGQTQKQPSRGIIKKPVPDANHLLYNYAMKEHTMKANDLVSKHCKPCKKGMPPLDNVQVKKLLSNLPAWKASDGAIAKTYSFENYYQTMAFVNATAWISHKEDHHPDLKVGFNKCEVRYSTHSVGGLSENDFICAAKVEALVGR